MDPSNYVDISATDLYSFIAKETGLSRNDVKEAAFPIMYSRGMVWNQMIWILSLRFNTDLTMWWTKEGWSRRR